MVLFFFFAPTFHDFLVSISNVVFVLWGQQFAQNNKRVGRSSILVGFSLACFNSPLTGLDSHSDDPLTKLAHLMCVTHTASVTNVYPLKEYSHPMFQAFISKVYFFVADAQKCVKKMVKEEKKKVRRETKTVLKFVIHTGKKKK